MMLDFSSLSKACASLQESLEVIDRYLNNGGLKDQAEYRTFRAGAIQNFEFTYELSWKAIRTWLAENIGKTVVDGITRKELFRLAAESLLIEDTQQWFGYHRLRNQTSHTYQESTADEVFEYIDGFVHSAQALLSTLNSKND